MKTLLLLLPLLLVACGGVPLDQIGEDYRVVVSPDFDSGQETKIYGAMDAWTRAVGVRFVLTDSCAEGEPRCITIKPSVAGQIGGDVGYDVTSRPSEDSEIVIWNEELPLATELVAIHEFGHALGLSHTGPNTIMCADLDCMSRSGVTCDDARQYFAVRGLSVPSGLSVCSP